MVDDTGAVQISEGDIGSIRLIEPTEKENEKIQTELQGLAAYVQDQFYKAEHGRYGDEKRWLDAYRDYRGIYSSNVEFNNVQQSQVFVKIAKTKTLAAYGQLIEVVFSGGKFPIGIKPTEEPQGIADKATLKSPDGEETPSVGFIGDGFKSAKDALGGLVSKLGKAEFDFSDKSDPNQPVLNPALETARNMDKVIQDQLTEVSASKELRKMLFEQCLYGTGVLKGPFTYEKTIHRWGIEATEEEDLEAEKTFHAVTLLAPKVQAVSVWQLYPDPTATEIEDADYIVERHKMTRHQLRQLRKQPFFNTTAIALCVEHGPDYVNRGYEDNLRDQNDQQFENDRWEVLEFWGNVDTELAVQAGLELPEDWTWMDEVQVNVWKCHDQIIRIVLNPFEPNRIPYQVVPYEMNPHEFFGIGVPENMADSTIIMNGHARMAIDNLAISGHIMLDIDEQSLAADEDFSIYAGKVWRRQAGTTGQAVYPIKFPNTTNENMIMFDKFRQLADEQTGIPSYSHGQTGITSTTRTASGMSMLMGAAALNIKTVIKNLDDYLLEPVGKAFYHWNMQFNDRPDIKGDLDVKAMGTDAVMQKEVRSQKLTQLLQIAANPAIAPFFKLHKLAKELAISLDLDPEDIVNDPDEAKIYAAIIGQAGQLMVNTQGQSPQGAGSPAQGAGGMMPPGAGSPADIPPPALPGEQGFSGSVSR